MAQSLLSIFPMYEGDEYFEEEKQPLPGFRSGPDSAYDIYTGQQAWSNQEPVVVEAEKEQFFSGLMGELGVRPRGEAPFQTMTPTREMQIGADGEMTPVLGQGMLDYYDGNVPVGVVERAPYASGRGFETIGAKQDKIKSAEEQKAKDRIWGNYAYNPKDAQKRYEDSMQDILRKSMMLNLLAQLTGGKSMAAPFVEMSTKRLEMEETFKDQGRLQDIQRGIYYTQDGLYDPPKNQQEAFDRAMKFGASPALAEKISGYAPAEDTRDYNNWYNTETGEVEVRRTGDKPEGNGWVKGTPSAKSEGSPGTRVKFLNELRDIALTGNLEDAINRYISYKMLGSNYVGGDSSQLRKEAYQAVFGTVPAQNKVKLEVAPTLEEEAQMKQQNPNLLYWMSADGKMGVFN